MDSHQTLRISGKRQGGRPIRQDQLWWTDWLTRLLCSQLGLVATCAGLTRRIARASLTALRRYAETGAGDVKRVQTQSGLRLRVGEWRVFFTQPDKRVIEIDAILHRRDAYRRS